MQQHQWTTHTHTHTQRIHPATQNKTLNRNNLIGGGQTPRPGAVSPVPIPPLPLPVPVSVPVPQLVVLRRLLSRQLQVVDHGHHAASLAPEPAGLEPPGLLVGAVELRLDGAADPQRRDGRPDAALPAQDPVLERFLGRRLEQPDEIARRHLGHERHAGARDLLVHQETTDAGGQELERVELAQPVADLEAHHADQKRRHRGRLVARFDERGPVHVALQKGDQVGARLADDEVVDIEELGDAQQGGLAVRVGHLGPVARVDRVGRLPGDDVALRVLAQDPRLAVVVEGWGGGVGGDCCRPYQLKSEETSMLVSAIKKRITFLPEDTRGVTYHIRSRQVVEEGRNPALPGCGHRNVEHPLAPLVRLLKRQLTHVAAYAVLEHLDVQEIPIPSEPLRPPQQRQPPRPERLDFDLLPFIPADGGRAGLAREGRQVDPLAAQHAGKLLLGVDGHEGGYQGARGGAADDARKEAPEEERFCHAQVAQTEDGAALENEGAPPKGLARVVDEVELGLGRHDDGGHSASWSSYSGYRDQFVVIVVRVTPVCIISKVHSKRRVSLGMSPPLRLSLPSLSPLLFNHSRPVIISPRSSRCSRQHANILNHLGHLGDILLDQKLSPREAAVV